MGAEVYASLPFEEAIAFFRGKVNVPTARWNDLWQNQHDTGFMVAGAAKAELLSDLRAAVDKAIAEGTTLEEFRRDFDTLVDRHGWTYKGGRAWRTEVIYSTNLRTAHAAGRFEQMTTPEVLKERPFWEYRHRDSLNPRQLHVSWDGTVLPADDPWWRTHYGPNGWGCKCTAFALSRDDLEALGKKGPDPRPDDGERNWTDKVTGEVKTVPNGIDPGWAYTPGRSMRAAETFIEKAGTLPADIGAAMVAEQLDVALPHLSRSFGRWADEVLKDGFQFKGERRVIGALSPRVVSHLAATGNAPAHAAIVVSDRELLHMARDVKQAAGRAVPGESLRDLPGIIARPMAVLRDQRDGTLLYVFDPPGADARLGKLVVRVGLHERKRRGDGVRTPVVVNAVRTAGLVHRIDLVNPQLYNVIEGSL